MLGPPFIRHSLAVQSLGVRLEIGSLVEIGDQPFLNRAPSQRLMSGAMRSALEAAASPAMFRKLRQHVVLLCQLYMAAVTAGTSHRDLPSRDCTLFLAGFDEWAPLCAASPFWHLKRTARLR